MFNYFFNNSRGVHYGLFGNNLWKLKIQLVLLRGFERIDFIFILTKLIFPLLLIMLDHLCVPYCLGKTLGLFFSESYLYRSLIMRYSFAVYFILRQLIESYEIIKERIIKLHNDIRDSRYLLGTELNNR